MPDPDPWQEAQERVLLYLKKLGVPAILSLEIAGEALHEAAEAAPAAGSPLMLAMRALHGILRQKSEVLARTPYADYPVLYRRWQAETMPAADPRISPQPPINRASMTIKKL